jgi:uncharacterized protein (DUF433 family)
VAGPWAVNLHTAPPGQRDPCGIGVPINILKWECPAEEFLTAAGLRVTVGMIVGQIAGGATAEQLLTEYPYLQPEDIAQALRYAAWRAEEREITLVSA